MCACMQRREDPGRPEAPKLFSLLAVFVTASDAFVHQNSCAHLARLSNLAGDLYEVDLQSWDLPGASRVGIFTGRNRSTRAPQYWRRGPSRSPCCVGPGTPDGSCINLHVVNALIRLNLPIHYRDL